MANADASASLLGYLYQIEFALTLCLEWGPSHPTSSLKVEMFDDISFDNDGAPFALAQVKYHQGSLRSITDKSVDLWKTLGIWMSSAAEARHLLLTTQIAEDSSAAARLRSRDDRDVKGALALLDAAAAESQNAETNTQRTAWLEATPSVKLRLLQNVVVVDGEGDIDEIRARADQLLSIASPAGSSGAFIDEVRGTWYRLVIAMLLRYRDGVSFLQFQNMVSDIRDRFNANALITTVMTPEGAELASLIANHTDYMFVSQMKWIDAPPSQIDIAITDYYRATEQKAHWVDNSYLDYLEIEDFKVRLVTEWRMLFDWAAVEAVANGQDAGAVGRALFLRVMTEVRERIRADYDEPFIRRGTYHEVADSGEIGWHPDFETKVRDALGIEP